MPARKTTTKAADIEVIVTVADEHLSKLPALAAQLMAKGLKVAHTMESTGMISGSAPRGKLAQLRAVDGVTAIEASGSMQIAPPDAEVQ